MKTTYLPQEYLDKGAVADRPTLNVRYGRAVAILNWLRQTGLDYGEPGFSVSVQGLAFIVPAKELTGATPDPERAYYMVGITADGSVHAVGVLDAMLSAQGPMAAWLELAQRRVLSTWFMDCPLLRDAVAKAIVDAAPKE